MRDYTKIEAWRLADDLTVAVYERHTVLAQRRDLWTNESIAPSCLFGSWRTSSKAPHERARKITFTFFTLRAARYQRLNISFTSRERLGYLPSEEADATSETNESNIWLFARSDSGSREGNGKTRQSGRNRHEPDRDRADALVWWSVVRGLVVVLSDSPFPSPNRDNAHQQRLLEERLHRYAPDLCW